MAKKNYTITVKLNKSEMPNFQKFIEEKVMTDIGPEMYEAIKEIILYKNMEPGQGKSIPEFLVSSAGIFPAGIIERLNKRYLNFGKGTASGVKINSITKGTEVEIKAELNSQAKVEFADFSPAAIIRMVGGLDPSRVRKIFREAVKEAELD